MKVNHESPGAPDICVYLDGEIMGCVEEADDEQGYVLKKTPKEDGHGGYTYEGVEPTRLEGKVELRYRLSGGTEVPYSAFLEIREAALEAWNAPSAVRELLPAQPVEEQSG